MQYRIPDQNLEKLQEQLERLAKRAAKLELTEPTITIVRQEPETLADGTVQLWHIVEITGKAPIINGWQFAAVIQFVQDDDGNVSPLFRSVPDISIPVELRSISEPFCDHCQLMRRRKDTYLVRQTETLEWKQVGSSCLADFTGHASPQALARYAQELMELEELAQACTDPDAFGSGKASHFSTLGWVSDSAMMIREHGWVSKGKAYNDGGVSTFSRVDANLFAPRYQRENPTTADIELAKKALEWVREELAAKDDLSDYEYNLTVACKSSFAERRLLGLITSLLPAYARAETQRIEQALAGNSEWQGEIGAKKFPTGPATVLGCFDSEGFYGMTHIIAVRNDDGHHFKWFCSSLPKIADDAWWNPQAGQRVELTGTVKDHSEWQGVKETVLTRCKVKLI